jgi:hypothetical protein
MDRELLPGQHRSMPPRRQLGGKHIPDQPALRRGLD